MVATVGVEGMGRGKGAAERLHPAGDALADDFHDILRKRMSWKRKKFDFKTLV